MNPKDLNEIGRKRDEARRTRGEAYLTRPVSDIAIARLGRVGVREAAITQPSLENTHGAFVSEIAAASLVATIAPIVDLDKSTLHQTDDVEVTRAAELKDARLDVAKAFESAPVASLAYLERVAA